ncbi:MAG: SLC13 family permease [Planctomycetota bacterium]|nr:SLC13 family permease [Planctomycetota bacterium]
MTSVHTWKTLCGLLISGFAPFLPGIINLPVDARSTAAVVVFTAWCWLTGALPLPIASLLPVVLLPATGVISARDVAPLYFQDILMLFLGGFILAIALEHHNLHKRFALRALSTFGTRPSRVILGFMVAGAGLSMFVSNTSTALLLLPVALAVLDGCEEENRKQLTAPLLLGIAYACSIGGVATPIGTAPNSVFLGQMMDRFPEMTTIGFGTWFIGAFPLVVIFLATTWWVLTRISFRLPTHSIPGLEQLRKTKDAQPPRTQDQNKVALVFGGVALAWMTRQGADFGSINLPGWETLLPETISASISDASVAMLGVIILFLLPDKNKNRLLEWEDCKNIPWGILLLLGGGFALAKACEVSGLSNAIGQNLGALITSVSPLMAIFVTCLGITFLTEITSNTATINLMLPLLFSACIAADVHPMLLAVPATFAVSCAFMLPVATPPNAILFASGRLRMGQMAKAGFLLNLVTAVLVTLVTYCWTLPAWGFEVTR